MWSYNMNYILVLYEICKKKNGKLGNVPEGLANIHQKSFPRYILN